MKRAVLVLRWIAVLPLALLSALATAWVIKLIDPPNNSWVYSAEYPVYAGLTSFLLTLVPVLSAAWTAPSRRLGCAITAWVLFFCLQFFAAIVSLALVGTRGLLDGPVPPSFLGGALACLLVWFTQRPRPA